jgi:hypothetical protein
MILICTQGNVKVIPKPVKSEGFIGLKNPKSQNYNLYPVK